MQFVIFHGAFGSPEGNWFPELKERLEDLGQEVITPKFPVEKWNDIAEQNENYHSPIQTLQNWLVVFEKEVLPKLNQNDKLCFIGHSLGPVFILHCVKKFNIQLDSAIFVSPFLETLPMWEFNVVNETFYKNDFDFEKLKQLIPVSYVLYSDNDPYVPQDQPKLFAERLGSSLIPIRKAGHLNSEVNLNELPLVFDLCTTRLDLSLWQQYLAHRKQIFGLDFVRERPGSLAIFQPEEIFDWQIFLYEHLQKNGFCTFYTGVKFWDNKSKYFEDARNAAKRIKNFVRVFLVEQTSDLKNLNLREQIRLDQEAGITTYLCPLEKVQDEVGEVDFGVWDNEYLCIVRFDKSKNASGIEINTKAEDLQKAMLWEHIIMQHAIQITNADSDLEGYIATHKDNVIILNPDEIEDEGTFKFRHLKNSGFATFYLPGTPFWDTHSKYAEEARLAAKRVGNIQRVFIGTDKKDFMEPHILKQMQLDIEAGIQTYVVLEKDIIDDVKELDFGIWDNEYVCIVNLDENNKVIDARLSAVKSDIQKANEWKEKILEKSHKITTFEEIQHFSE